MRTEHELVYGARNELRVAVTTLETAKMFLEQIDKPAATLADELWLKARGLLLKCDEALYTRWSGAIPIETVNYESQLELMWKSAKRRDGLEP